MNLITKIQMSVYLLLIRLGLFSNILTKFKFYELEDLINNENFKFIESEKFFDKIYNYFIVAKKIG